MNILVSSCILGEDVRYDGTNCSIINNPKISFSLKELFYEILENNKIYSLCPEVYSGLEIPRSMAEIQSSIKPFKVVDIKNNDVTLNFLNGAKKSLEFCKNENIYVALLKSNSPSCSNKKIYDGSFTKTLIDGSGFTAKLLEENGIKVFNEYELLELSNFIKNFNS